MENSGLKTRILGEIEKIISRNEAKGKMTQKVMHFHEAIIKRYYNATDVSIDYHRHRVKMNVIVDDSLYQPQTANVNLPLVPFNLYFKNLKEFLISCIEKDAEHLAFYARLLRSFAKAPLEEQTA